MIVGDRSQPRVQGRRLFSTCPLNVTRQQAEGVPIAGHCFAARILLLNEVQTEEAPGSE